MTIIVTKNIRVISIIVVLFKYAENAYICMAFGLNGGINRTVAQKSRSKPNHGLEESFMRLS